jgi:hypothetical protein
MKNCGQTVEHNNGRNDKKDKFHCDVMTDVGQTVEEPSRKI